jgi:hypothetical protein
MLFCRHYASFNILFTPWDTHGRLVINSGAARERGDEFFVRIPFTVCS